MVSSGGRAADEAALLAFVASLGRDDIRVLRVPDSTTLGRKRNLSVAAARGDILCVWDDDDRHHPLRLERQLRALAESGLEAVFLEDVLMYFEQRRILYWTNWRATEIGGLTASMMFAKAAQLQYPEIGPSASLGEDVVAAAPLLARNGCCGLGNAPYLYVYFVHGANTCQTDHFNMLSDRLAISQGLLRRREALVREGLREFDGLFGPGSVQVQGSNGPAFTLAGSAAPTPG